MAQNWGYKTDNGPHTWAENFAEAAGKRQSPININTTKVSLDEELTSNPLTWNWPTTTVDVTNTGYGWKAHVHGEESSLTGGPLKEGDTYQLEQYHMHWGADDSTGSEHLVDKKSYAGEIHFVHWNTKYGSFCEALNHGDGLAVLGAFVTVGNDNKEIQPLIDLLPEIKFRNQTAKFEKADLNPANLLPESRAYWTYPGSLTTPPCSECVIWIVLKDPIEMSSAQFEALRSMNSLEKEQCECNEQGDETIRLNFRPCLKKAGRCVRAGYC